MTYLNFDYALSNERTERSACDKLQKAVFIARKPKRVMTVWEEI